MHTAYERLSCCTICAWECKVDRRAGKMGICRTGETARVSSYGAHMGEEDGCVAGQAPAQSSSAAAICTASSARTTISARLTPGRLTQPMRSPP